MTHVHSSSVRPEPTREKHLMTPRWKPVRDERGQGALVLAVVLVVVLVAVVLLVRTQALASTVSNKTEQIAVSGRGINQSTDAVIQLNRTNEFGRSILSSTQPLSAQTTRIVEIARSIDGLATSINGTAQTINSTANGINGTATQILGTAQSIKRGVEQINRNADVAIALAQQIKRDLDVVDEQVADGAHRVGACIDQAATGNNDGHCR
jgi:methyl-accepting chemotaxis protein